MRVIAQKPKQRVGRVVIATPLAHSSEFISRLRTSTGTGAVVLIGPVVPFELGGVLRVKANCLFAFIWDSERSNRSGDPLYLFYHACPSSRQRHKLSRSSLIGKHVLYAK